MSKFLLIYHGGSIPQDEKEIQQVMGQWQAWFQSLGNSVIDAGNPVGRSTTVLNDGIVESDGGSNPVSGYSVIEAENQEAAETLAQGCPIRERGGSIEVAEILQM